MCVCVCMCRSLYIHCIAKLCYRYMYIYIGVLSQDTYYSHVSSCQLSGSYKGLVWRCSPKSATVWGFDTCFFKVPRSL